MRLGWLEYLVALLDNRSMDAAARFERARKLARPVSLLVEHETAMRELA